MCQPRATCLQNEYFYFSEGPEGGSTDSKAQLAGDYHDFSEM